jgi:hypothetical protein
MASHRNQVEDQVQNQQGLNAAAVTSQVEQS